MAGTNGKQPTNRHTDPAALVDMQDITIEGVKALFPEVQQAPLFTPQLDSGNAGIRLISNDGSLLEMLKIVYVENYEMADNYSDALGECDEFLLDENGKPCLEVLQRVEWIKYRLALYCSVKGRFADAYKQTATGVLTNAMSDRGGWVPLQLPIGGINNHNQKTGGGPEKGKGRP